MELTYKVYDELKEESLMAEKELAMEDLWEDGEINKREAMEKLRNLYIARTISFATFNYYLEEVK